MKKSNFTAMILGTIGMVFFALGMCMALLPEWGMFRQGIAAVCTGVFGALLFGIGMCLTMIFAKMILGIVIGLAGMIVLMMLIPLTKGLKSQNTFLKIIPQYATINNCRQILKKFKDL